MIIIGRCCISARKRTGSNSGYLYTTKVTDRKGQDISSARVGDSLSIKFEILDVNSPFEIFVRELVAMDGSDRSEILLIDADGCPTDVSILSGLAKGS